MITWKLNDKTVEFIPETHEYVVEGILVPSVTEICKKFFSDDYKTIPIKTLENAAQRGTELHEAIELYETTGEEKPLAELANYKFLKKQLNIVNLKNEVPVFYERDGIPLFAGRIDQIMKMGDTLYINDFKRVSAPNKEKIAMQLNLYHLAYEQCYKVKIDGLSFMQLREEKRKLYPVKINEPETLKIIDLYFKEI